MDIVLHDQHNNPINMVNQSNLLLLKKIREVNQFLGTVYDKKETNIRELQDSIVFTDIYFNYISSCSSKDFQNTFNMIDFEKYGTGYNQGRIIWNGTIDIDNHLGTTYNYSGKWFLNKKEGYTRKTFDTENLRWLYLKDDYQLSNRRTSAAVLILMNHKKGLHLGNIETKYNYVYGIH